MTRRSCPCEADNPPPLPADYHWTLAHPAPRIYRKCDGKPGIIGRYRLVKRPGQVKPGAITIEVVDSPMGEYAISVATHPPKVTTKTR